MKHALSALAVTSCLISMPVGAQEVRISDGAVSVSFMVNARQYTIERSQDQAETLSGDYARVARPCPSECLQPLVPDAAIKPLAELELIAFLESAVANDKGFLIDARLPESFAAGTIPGAVNIPAEVISATNPYRDDVLGALGAVKDGSGYDFSGAKSLAVFADGAWDQAGVGFINHLIEAGYPKDKILYYRGGLQIWSLYGFLKQTS